MNVRARFACSAADGEVKIHSSVSETGESEESIPVEYDGPAVEIGFNAQYMLDFLRAVSDRTGELPVQRSAQRGRTAARRREAGQLPLRDHADEDLNCKHVMTKHSYSDSPNCLRFHQYQSAGRPGGRAPASRYVHRLDRRSRSASPGVRSGGQFRRRSAGRLLPPKSTSPFTKTIR